MKNLQQIDSQLIYLFQKISLPLGRISLFLVFFWFGILKIIGESPANPLVSDLLKSTLPFITFDQFIFWFGLYEMVIGTLFLLNKPRAAILLLIPHMVATALPLFMLPSLTWQKFLVPTLEGQYIIKNIVIIALAISIGANLKPIKQ